MIPLRDNIPSRTTPLVNYALIGITAFAFVVQLLEPESEGGLVERLGMIPARVVDPDAEIVIPTAVGKRIVYEERWTRDGIVRVPRVAYEVEDRPAEPSAVPPVLTPLTCIFLHGGWMHFLGNMWFLFIFGDNVEDRFGRGGYLAFYLASGVAASLSHLVTDPQSTVPTIGASGAIAGVMGAYLVSYPHARVMTLIPIFYIIRIEVLPAPIFLGIWFVIQLFQGVAAVTSVQTTGVAWWAHIGGFAVGAGIAWMLDKWHWLRPRRDSVPLSSQRLRPVRRRHPRSF
ncbi:MAG: rhomboid family intramembrane serine protease [Planctomycetota bacterium]|nr:MAG: rhomboid family intramembrane serine protease [Planctomycetota bacterium]REK21000.1 MAG: rhomboid family intramembrane serine protease [Planctomycetota bacterium]REK37341.1 MAG: rhomboid family intramembrane serine protease [Planctomycetota bacterium]